MVLGLAELEKLGESQRGWRGLEVERLEGYLVVGFDLGFDWRGLVRGLLRNLGLLRELLRR